MGDKKGGEKIVHQHKLEEGKERKVI